MSRISTTRMIMASFEGQPFISGLWKRGSCRTARRAMKTTQASNTPTASISKLPIKKSYKGPRKAPMRCVPKMPSITISATSMLMMTKPM